METKEELLEQLRKNKSKQESLYRERTVLSDQLIVILLDESTGSLEPAPKKRTKPKAPDLDAIVKRYHDYEPAASGCLCGCGEETAEGSKFLKGHQNRLRSIVAAVDADRLPIFVIPVHAFEHIAASGWLPEGRSFVAPEAAE